MDPDKVFSSDEIRKILKKHASKTVSKMILERSKEELDADTAEKILKNSESMQQPIVGYKMLDKMGSGGMAVVFKAENMDTGELVALKMLYPGHVKDKLILKQFINEGMMLLKLNHTNIIKGIDFGISKGFYFLAMEYVEGESLISFLEKGFRFTEEHAFQIILQIAKALRHLEEQGIVHRDVKPANILLVSDVAKLCDFAFAIDINKKDEKEDDDEVTCGTVAYISPEQARGQSNINSKSDIYSLGITCIHMIAGKLPFRGEDPNEVMRQHIYEPLRLPRASKFSSTAKKIIAKMVAKKTKNRFTPSKLVPILEKFLKN